MGTHGRRGFSRLALGSDADLVVRQSPVPVLLVRDESGSILTRPESCDSHADFSRHSPAPACSTAAASVRPRCGRPAANSSARQAAAFSTLVASRSATVVDISTLRIGRDESEGDMDLEFAPENDFADRLAWPLPASAQDQPDPGPGLRNHPLERRAHPHQRARRRSVDEAQVRLDDGRRFTARLVGSDRQNRCRAAEDRRRRPSRCGHRRLVAAVAGRLGGGDRRALRLSWQASPPAW